MPGEAEPVAQRPGEQAGPGGRADQGERCQFQRDRGRARALADHHVDPEVLHRHVEQFLGRPGDPVDLVDEQHLALGEAGQQRGQVAGPLDRRAGGQPERRAQLGGDDHGQAGLAQARRPGQQHVVRRPLAAQGALQHHLQLLAHLRLAHELAQPARAQAGLDARLVHVGQRRDDVAVRFPQALGRPGHRLRPSSWMARRRMTGTSGLSPASAAPARSPRPASLPVKPRPASACSTWSRHGAMAVTPASSAPAAPAVDRADPVPQLDDDLLRALAADAGHLHQRRVGRWSRWRGAPRAAGTRRGSSGRASDPPRWRSAAARTGARSSSSANPYRVSESSRTTRLVASRAVSPTRSRARVPGEQDTARPTPPTSTTAPSGPEGGHPAVHAGDHRRTPIRRPRRTRALAGTGPRSRAWPARPRPGGPAPRRARGGRWPAPARRRRRPAAGPTSSLRIRVTIAVTWALSAVPEPVIAALTSDGVCRCTAMPGRAAATIARPAAWAVPVTVRTLCWANTRSTTTTSGRCSAHRGRQRVGERAAAGRPACPRPASGPPRRAPATAPGRRRPVTTPTPHRVRPGSTPSTRMSGLTPASVRTQSNGRSTPYRRRVRRAGPDTRRGRSPGARAADCPRLPSHDPAVPPSRAPGSGPARSSCSCWRWPPPAATCAWQATRPTRTARFGVFLFILAGWVVTLSPARVRPRLPGLAVRRRRGRGPRLPDPEPAEVQPPGAVDPAAGAVHRDRRHRPARRRGLPAPAPVPHQRPAQRWSRCAGPLVNVVFAVLLLVLVAPGRSRRHRPPGFFWYAVAGLALLQVMASVLNLLPVPGLDGYGAIEPYLDPKFRQSPSSSSRSACWRCSPCCSSSRSTRRSSG